MNTATMLTEPAEIVADWARVTRDLDTREARSSRTCFRPRIVESWRASIPTSCAFAAGS